MIRKLIIATLLLGSASICFAPIGDKGPLKIEHERGQGQVTEEQARYQKSQGQVGEVPLRTEQSYVDGEASDKDASQAMGAALKQDSQSSGNAADVLAAASRQAAERGGFPWLWAVIMAAAGVGTVFGLRAWANKLAPVPADFRLPPSRG